MLVSMVASAQKSDAITRWEKAEDILTLERLRLLNEGAGEQPHAIRHFLLRQKPTDTVLDIYVQGGVSTIISLPSELQTRGTSIGGGGDGRFNVLMGGQQILITPTRGLAKGERFPLRVTLVDGTVIPLSLTSAPEGHRADGEVQISTKPENPEQLRVQLEAMTERAITLEAQLDQALKEQQSKEHGLAGLLAGGHAKLTAFVRVKERDVLNGRNREVLLETYVLPPETPDAPTEVAAVFTVTNKGTEPLEFSAVRAMRSPGLEFVSLAARFQPRVISPGGKGTVAVVVDRAAFGPDGGKLTLDVFSKHEGGQREFSTDLVVEDVEARESNWWPLF
jgi:hypothetical protein